MANPAPTINQINAFNATQGTTIDFNIIGGTELIRSNRIYIYDLSDNSLICTHLYVSTESIHELPANTDGSIVYESGKSSADFVNGAQYYAQIQTYTDTNGTQGGSGLSVAKMFWCLGDPTLTITTIPSTISTTSYNISATYTDTSASVVSNIIQQYQFNLYSATGSLLQSSGVVVGSGTQQGTSDVYDISYNFTGLNVGSSYYVTVDVTTTQGMSVTTQSNTFTVSIDTPTLGEATVVNNACDGYISVTSNLSGEYGGSGSGEIVSFETDSENVFSKLQVDLEPIQEGSGTPSPSNVRPIRRHSGVTIENTGVNIWDEEWEVGGIDHSTGENNSITVVIRSKNYISCVPSTTYYFADSSNTGSPYIHYYDVNREFVSYAYISGSATFVTPSNACYIRFNMDIAYGATYKNDISINYPSTDHDYHEYNAQTTTQNFNVSLTPTSTDTTPYLFKAVGDVYGDRLEDKIVGGTVAWNQLVLNANKNYINGETTDTRAEVLLLIQNTVSPIVYAYDTLVPATGRFEKVFKVTQDIGGGLKIKHGGLTRDLVMYVNNDQSVYKNHVYAFAADFAGIDPTVANGLSVNNIQLFDLTQMFGSTIADYIYSLEQSQAGAGVAWFKKLFPNDYYAYNAGELLSVEGLQSHDSVGFNQFDEETYFTTNGFTKNSEGYWTRVGYPASHPHLWDNKCGYTGRVCIKHTSYRSGGTNASFRFRYTDGTWSFSFIPDTSTTEQTLSQSGKVVEYIDYDTSASPTIFMKDICINLSDPSRNGEYEPYKKYSYPLDSSLTLRGIPKLDANNNLYYDGDEYTSDGKVKRKYGVVDLGSIEWEQGGSNNKTSWVPVSWRTNVKPAQSIEVKANILCNKYYTDTSKNVERQVNDKTICVNTMSWVYIYDSAYVSATPQEFKAAMSGVMLVYELATQTTQTATPYTNPQIVSKYGTLEYVTNSIVPVGHKTTYLTRDIFGGYVDLISGKLVVTHGYGTLNGQSEGIRFTEVSQTTTADGTKYVAYSPLNLFGMKLNNTALCDSYDFKDALIDSLHVGEFNARGSYMRFVIADQSLDTLIKWNNYLANNPIHISYELATPQTYQLTPQQVNTLVGTNNVWSEQGNVELSYHIPITNLLVKRQDVDDVSGGWLTLYSQPISQASDMDFTFIDFLNQYGKTYKYALVPLLTQIQSGVEVEVEGGYTVSDEVQSVFDGVFIADSTGSQKCKANVGYGNVDMNQVVGSITPIGAKYPIIITNSHNQYHNGSISGTIVPDDYYFNGNLSRIDMVNKRNELEQFLTNKRVKVIKDWNGNIWLVMIVGNVSCTFNNNYGMGIVNFSTNWTEVGNPTNQQDLQATGLINVGGV